ncbi:MAG: dolichol-phosphate mannosyltransferase, partial [Chloroflexota bacterium]|nr:dolichol-phosphate mannosyltransferase [Chloroflexota bacterium]
PRAACGCPESARNFHGALTRPLLCAVAGHLLDSRKEKRKMQAVSESTQTAPLVVSVVADLGVNGAQKGSARPAYDLSVVVPTRNEAGNVAALRDQLAKALAELNYEVVVVDDSNDDETRPLLRAASAADPRWTIIERPAKEQSGLGTAVAAGIAAARGDAVCVMDGDLQHPPEIIPKLLAKIHEGADLAVASRYMKGGSRAGLAGSSRVWVSRLCTWLAHMVFPETQRTSDPLTGFFCCKRRHVSGLEMRPMGFKILLELLVCTPTLKVADVPFVFAARNAGESKASTRQGILFLKHLVSLFVYVPGSSRWLKLAIVTGCGLAVFSSLTYTMTRGGLDPISSWIIASAATLGCGIAFQQVVTIREFARHGEPDDTKFQYPFAIVAALGSFTLLSLLTLQGRHALLALAVLAQSFGVLLTAGLDHPWIWSRVRSRMPLPTLDLRRLGLRLEAQRAFWVLVGEAPDPAHLQGLGKLVTADLIAAVGLSGQPLLLVDRPSARPQPRVNIDSSSALIVPRLDDRGEVVAMAVLARHGRHPFNQRQLDEAMAWICSTNRWHDSGPPLMEVQ